MSRLRVRFLVTVVWAFLLAVTSAESLLPISGTAQILSLLALVCFLVVPQLPSLSLRWPIAGAVALVLGGRLAAGHSLVGDQLGGTLVDGFTVIISIVLAAQVGESLDEFYRAVSRVMLQGVAVRPRRLRHVQSRMYRDVCNARLSKQPLTLLAVSTNPQDCEEVQDRMTVEAMQKLARDRLQARVAELLRRETRNCGTIACFDHHLITLLPAIDRAEVESTIESLRAKARQSLKVELAIGSASFPKEEVTLVGLLQRAESQMRRQCLARDESPADDQYLFVGSPIQPNSHPAPQA